MKAAGAEVDICSGSECTSGWYFARPILMGAVVIDWLAWPYHVPD
jgi:hypothetical protein